jgi:hypothetical protein
MAARRHKPEQLRQDVAAEREKLAHAVDHLHAELREATNVRAKLRANLPIVAAGALGAGFFVAGGVGATMRLLARRGREGREKARFGRFKLVDRD